MGLKGRWHLDETYGDSAQDTSGYNNTGILEGFDPIRVSGKSGNCLDFDGSNDLVDMGNSAPINDIGNGDFSISFWMKSKDAVPLNYGGIITKYLSSNDLILIDSVGITNQLRVYIKIIGEAAVTTNFDAAPFDAVWNHIVLVVNRTTDIGNIYINNVVDAQTLDFSGQPVDLSNIGRLALGARNNGTFLYEGLIDEINIYDYVLSPTKINMLYNNPGGEIGTEIGQWHFDEAEGLIAYDTSVNSNDGTIIGSTEYWLTGKSGNALNFDGIDDLVNMGNGSPLDQLGNGDFSISLWMKSKDTVPLFYGRLLSKGSATVELYSNDVNNRLRATIGAIGITFSVGSAPFDGTFHHVVLVANRTTDLLFLYIDTIKDSVEGDLSTLPDDISSSADLLFGKRSIGSPYEGLLDEINIYDHALSELEIDYLFNNPTGIQNIPKYAIVYNFNLTAVINETEIGGIVDG